MLTLDLKSGWRALGARPGPSAAAILTLALGIGATSTVFTVVHRVLLAPLPYPEPGELVRVYATSSGHDIDRAGLAGADFADFARTLESFEHLGAYRWHGLALSDAERPRDLATILVTPGLLAELGTPRLGRTFLPEEAQPGEGGVVVLADGLWQSQFGADEGVLGRSLELDGVDYTVVGVMPEGFSFPAPGIELWAPWTYAPAELDRDSRSWNVVGRLARGVSLETACDELRTAAAALAEEYPKSNEGWSAVAVPLEEVVVGAARPALLALLGAVAMVLAIACANVANLLLVQGLSRRREMALRAALGARRAHLVRQLLVESLLLSVAGGALGAVLAYTGVAAVLRLELEGLPRIEEIALDGSVLAFALVLTLVTGLASGVVPALELAGRELGGRLRETGPRAAGPPGARRLRGTITVGQIALSLVLLVGAGLLLRSFLRLVDVESGFRPERRVALQLFVYGGKYDDAEQQRQFYARLLEELEALPGVRSAAGVSSLPLSPIGGGQVPVHVLGRAEPESSMAGLRIATRGYLETMGIPLRAGRAFSAQDREGSTRVALLNETAARRYFPRGDAVGSFLRGESEEATTQIVGIVGDVRHQGLDREPDPELYLPFQQNVSGAMSVVVETEGDPAPLVAAIQERVWTVDPTQSIWGAVSLEALVARDTARERFQSLLVALFAAVALFLAAVGLYGVLSFAVVERTREIGLRMAVGARRPTILTLVLGSGARLVGAGLGVGLVAALALVSLFSRLLDPFLFRISADDPATFVAASALLAFVGFVACLVPALRASRLDPIRALRYE